MFLCMHNSDFTLACSNTQPTPQLPCLAGHDLSRSPFPPAVNPLTAKPQMSPWIELPLHSCPTHHPLPAEWGPALSQHSGPGFGVMAKI